ncbi:MAG: patatin-like phospholipase family protein [Desulfobacteraceae bacterium]|nr:patatin-like phospholipase family protein [Desulfobacteraceae bacterium]
MINIFRRKKKIPSKKVGLALGSGSARGWAHIGVIRALAEAGVRVDYIAGTSIGALVGAVYASGGIDTLEEVVLQLDWKKIAYLSDVVFPKSGLIDGKKIAGFIQNHLKEINIEDLPLPFCAVSTDMTTGNEIAIKEGNIIEAVRASISVPGIFTPVKKNGVFLVDGGLTNPVPVSVVRQMGADFVIAVDLNHNIIGNTDSGKITDINMNKKVFEKKGQQEKREKNKLVKALNKRIKTIDYPALTHIREWMNKEPVPSIFEVLTSSINIMETQITATRLKTDPPDILIQPNLGHLKFLEYNRAKEAIDEGYKVGQDKIKSF